MSKIEPRVWKHGTDESHQRLGERGIMVERRGKDYSKNMYE